MNVLFYCPKNHQGTMVVTDAEWELNRATRICPKCGMTLEQKWLHFEALAKVEVERDGLLSKGVLTYAERERLRTIQRALGHRARTISGTRDARDTEDVKSGAA
jgi:hypothetical protein